MSDYLLDHDWLPERARLAALETALDPHSTRRLLATGVGPGWDCLEVGGGAGSLARWLCDRVGPTGSVTATDLRTEFLSDGAPAELTVRRHDIATDPLDTDRFDLVHCRAVLEHLPAAARRTAVASMVAALRPGGWLVVEDGDTVTTLPLTPPAGPGAVDLFDRCTSGFESFLVAHGAEPHYGRLLRGELAVHGLRDLTVDGVFFEWGGDLAATEIWVGNYRRLGERVVAAGLLDRREVDEFLALVTRPDFRAWTPALVTAAGRRP